MSGVSQWRRSRAMGAGAVHRGAVHRGVSQGTQSGIFLSERLTWLCVRSRCAGRRSRTPTGSFPAVAPPAGGSRSCSLRRCCRPRRGCRRRPCTCGSAFRPAGIRRGVASMYCSFLVSARVIGKATWRGCRRRPSTCGSAFRPVGTGYPLERSCSWFPDTAEDIFVGQGKAAGGARTHEATLPGALAPVFFSLDQVHPKLNSYHVLRQHFYI